MRKMTAIPFLVATVMMFSVSGCGSVSENGTSEDVDVEDVSGDASTSETNTDESSSDENSTEVAGTDDSYANSQEITDDSFECEGKKISVLDDVDNVLANLGEYEVINKLDDGYCTYQNYNEAVGMIEVETMEFDGKPQVLSIFSSRKDVKTSKGIGLGNTREELIAAYGEPNSKSDDNFHDYVYEYDGYSITFSFGLEESIQHILYTNTPNYARYVGM